MEQIMPKHMKIILILLILTKTTETTCENSTFVELKTPLFHTLKNDPVYLEYVTIVTAGILGSLYVCYNCLASSYRLRNFTWKESHYSSTDHSFRNLNAWSYYHIPKMSLADMKYYIDTLLITLSIKYCGTDDPTDYHDNLARLDILSRFNLYQFRFFRKIIRSFPEYKAHILSTIQRIKRNPSFKANLSNIQGFKQGELVLFLTEEEKWIKAESELI